MWDLIVLIPDNYLLFYFAVQKLLTFLGKTWQCFVHNAFETFEI